MRRIRTEESERKIIMLVMEKTERDLCDCLLSSSDSMTPLSFRLMSSDARTVRGRDINMELRPFLCSGKVQ